LFTVNSSVWAWAASTRITRTLATPLTNVTVVGFVAVEPLAGATVSPDTLVSRKVPLTNVLLAVSVQ